MTPCAHPQMSPIQRGLKDRHPYVRRTAVMGVLKVYNFDADAVRNCGAYTTLTAGLTQHSATAVKPCQLCVRYAARWRFPSMRQKMAVDGTMGLAGMLETVRNMLTQDADPMVVSNCMSVIQKVCAARHACFEHQPFM